MTRKSKREIERALNDLEGDRHSPPAIVYEDPRTGEWYDGEGDDADRVSEDEFEGADPLIVMQRDPVVVMEREQALEEDREILGPAEDAPAADDPVRVLWGDSS
ncbi:hypothetical protein HWV07_04355 [Natronomonas salina]|uniref:hypothetical protein n=1 Tax=Natronomonas salina TaxID=1710540 RepID=UPI0015B66097|nr:hypothetical protein [Natronomonas salina]QLD88306.1 hypothetical protein HWV07_04355 [Natronomonas salina]